MPKLVHSVAVDGPGDRRVRVLFYDNGSIRFRVANAAPMKLSEAFLSGRDANVIVKLDPELPWQVEGSVEVPVDPDGQRQEIVSLLRDRDEIGALHRTKQVAERLRQETLAYTKERLNDQAFRPTSGRTKIEQFAPIWKPTLETLAPRMRQYTAAVVTLMEYAPARVFDAVVPLGRMFEAALPNGARHVTDLPRFVGATIGSTLLAYAIALRQYPAFAAVGRHRFKSYRGMRPWVLAPEFHHPDSLAHDAWAFGQILLEYLQGEDLDELGATSTELGDAAIAANVLLAVLGSADSEDRTSFCWGVLHYAHRIEPVIRDVATNRTARTEIASLVSEDADVFSAHFVERYQAHLRRGSWDTHSLDDEVLRLFAKSTP